MMKSWSRLCFLVLAVSSVSMGQSGIPGSQNNGTDHDDQSGSPNLHTPAPLSTDEPQDGITQLPTSAHTTDLPSSSITREEERGTLEDSANYFNDNDTDSDHETEEAIGSTAGVPGSGRKDADMLSPVSPPKSSTTQTPVTIEGNNQSSGGYVILVFIIIAIIVLCVLLYFLRRASRMYSFDLQRPAANNHLIEPTGTFEPVHLDDLDLPALKYEATTEEISPPPAANGTTLPSEEKASNGENAPQEELDANGLETSPTSDTSPSLGDDPADKTSSHLSSTNLFIDADGEEQQNGNNNNPSICSSDPFVEISLDDPVWSDQLFTFPEGSSSVLPISPFSISSSSS